MSLGPLIILEGIEKIASKLNELVVLNKERKEKRFENMFEPLFEHFIDVHSDYVSLFEKVNKALIEASYSNDPAKREGILSTIRQEFGAQRNNYDGMRTSIRAQAQQILLSTKSPTELRFVWTLLCYFLDWGSPFQSDEEIEAEASRVVKNGGSAEKNTPASVIMRILCDDSDCQKKQNNVRIRLENCSKDLSGVCKTYAQLKAETYK